MLKYQVFLISLFVVLFSSQVLAEIRINEIMYNPKDSIQCSDSSCEWVELYNDGAEIVNLSEWKLDGNKFDDAIILPKEYIAIARKLTDSSGGQSFEFHWGNNDGIWDSLDGNHKSLDGYFALTNDPGDTITLIDNNGKIASSVTYSNELANGNGYSLGFYDGSWYESSVIGGTPGSENSIKEIPQEETKQENTTEEADTATQNDNSNIGIKSISPESIKFGENVSVEVSVYKGSTAKYAVYFYIEKNGKKITAKFSEYARTKHQNYTFKYSAQLESNCDGKYEEGKYNIIIEGLDQYVVKEIEIAGNVEQCEETEVIEPLELESSPEKQEIATETESNINQNTTVTGNIVYESSDMKAQRVALYLFCFVLILLTIYLIKRNKNGSNNTSDNRNSGFS